jgi:hypothetical protein
LAAGFYVTATLLKGVPALRHDWLWPVEPHAFVEYLVSWTSGWDLSGLGRPATHVAQYLLVLPLLLIGVLTGSAAALGAYAALIGAVTAHAAVRIAKHHGLGPAGSLILAAFLCLNPWVYNKLVAGHLAMLLSYASTTLVWSELLAPQPDVRTTTLAMFGASFQPQFFFLAWAGCLVRRNSKAARTAAAYGGIALLPFLAGIASHPATVAAIPITTTWERLQSVRFDDALLLRGYFTHYDAPFDGRAGTIGVALFAAVAAVAIVACRGRMTAVVAALAIVLALVASGTRGPLAPLMTAGFENFPPFGFYRELYDVVGLIAAGYVLLSASAFARFPALLAAGAVSAALLAVVWVHSPPSRLWLNAFELPLTERGDEPGRYAVFPPYQPVKYGDDGSGIDPAQSYRSLQTTPLDTYLFQFPESTALEAYWRDGSTRELARLGTNRLICRQGFSESADAASLLGSAVLGPASSGCRQVQPAMTQAAPLFALQNGSHLCTLCRHVGDGDVFFGDVDPSIASSIGIAADASNDYEGLAHLRGGNDPRTEWIDARLSFASNPDIAQAFGGAFTTSTRLLQIAVVKQILVDVRGTLRDDRDRRIASDTNGYLWISLPPDVRALRCEGACAIALEGNPPRTASLEGGTAPSTALAWRRLAPWIVVVELPAGRRQLVRSLDYYDSLWFAMAGGRFAQHLRLDAALNGWLVSPHDAPETLVIVHGASALELLLEVIATLAFAAALFRRPAKG